MGVVTIYGCCFRVYSLHTLYMNRLYYRIAVYKPRVSLKIPPRRWGYTGFTLKMLANYNTSSGMDMIACVVVSPHLRYMDDLSWLFCPTIFS